MNCGAVPVKRAGEVGLHQISLEDSPELDSLQLLDSLRFGVWKIEAEEEKEKHIRS